MCTAWCIMVLDEEYEGMHTFVVLFASKRSNELFLYKSFNAGK